MPLYDFKCLDCGTKFETVVSMSDRNQAKCPKCQSAKTERLISKFAVAGRGDQRESTVHGCHDHDASFSDDCGGNGCDD